MPNTKNISLLDTLKEKVKRAKSITVTNYAGIKSEDMNMLRAKMRDANAEVAVAKNTLIKIALKDNEVLNDDLIKDLKGNTAIILGYEDAITPIKALFDFVKKVELPNIKSGVVEGVYNPYTKLEMLSKLPSRIALKWSEDESPVNRKDIFASYFYFTGINMGPEKQGYDLVL